MHLRIHIGENPYISSHCNKAFSTKSDLVTHIMTYTREKHHKCNQCDKVFSTKNILITHLELHSVKKHINVPNVTRLSQIKVIF